MDESHDVIVIGVGAMGSAACDALARRGVDVLGLERFDVPHAFGSSGGQTRLIRQAYFEHPDYVPLVQRAYALWDDLGARVGERLLCRTGCLYLGTPGGEVIGGTRRSAARHGLAIEELDARGVAERCGPFAVPAGFAALFEKDAGFVLCERAVAAFAAEARRHGASIRSGETVRSWNADRSGVRVITDRGAHSAAHLVITAGAWSTGLVLDLGVELRVTRQVVAWVRPKRHSTFAAGRFPCWAIEDEDAAGLYYGFPLLDRGQDGEPHGMKIGHHRVGPTVDPDAIDRTPTAEEIERLQLALGRYLPDADGSVRSSMVCMYTMSPDQHFVLDVHPTQQNVTVACGFSGHGFKFAPVVGEALADLATAGRTDLPIGFLGLGRFTRHG